MINPSILRDEIEAVERSLTSAYRSRVESYGPDAARTLLRFYDTLKEQAENAGPREDPS